MSTIQLSRRECLSFFSDISDRQTDILLDNCTVLDVVFKNAVRAASWKLCSGDSRRSTFNSCTCSCGASTAWSQLYSSRSLSEASLRSTCCIIPSFGPHKAPAQLAAGKRCQATDDRTCWLTLRLVVLCLLEPPACWFFDRRTDARN